MYVFYVYMILLKTYKMNSNKSTYIGHDGQNVVKSGNVIVIRDGKPVTYDPLYEISNYPKKTR